MAGGQERVLRRRIRSIQSTKKITRAMELIAASQIVRAKGRIAAAAPYERAIAGVLAEVAADSTSGAGRMLGIPSEPERVLILCVVADRGLCGAYNTSVLRTVERLVGAGVSNGTEFQVMTVGRKAVSYLRFRGQELAETFSGFTERPTFDDARRVAQAVTAPFLAQEVDQVLVVSTRFLTAGSQKVETRQLLPLPVEVAGSDEHEVPARAGYTEFEPDASEMLVRLLPLYAEAVLQSTLFEASASEHTARQRAMAAATDNADELSKSLSRVMNRARQDSITTEIMEIVGGAEALRQSVKAE